jgi:flagellar protein FliS
MNLATDIGKDHGGSPEAARSLNPYLRTRVLTAGPEELRLLLLEGAVKFACQGRDGLARKDFEASYSGISQCRAIVLELLTTIRTDIDPDLMDKVKGIYTFLYQELTTANIEKSVERMNKIIQLLEYETETWRLLMQKLAADRSNVPPSPTPDAETTERKPFSVSA